MIITSLYGQVKALMVIMNGISVEVLKISDFYKKYNKGVKNSF